MNIIKTDIPDVLVFEPRVFGDARGFFFESFSSKVFDEVVGRHVEFVQDNHSQSQKGVLRGLHYQLDPHAQGKLVRCVEGEVFDVAVDVRRSSPTFGQWVGVVLSADNHRQLWVPPGLAQPLMPAQPTRLAPRRIAPLPVLGQQWCEANPPAKPRLLMQIIQ